MTDTFTIPDDARPGEHIDHDGETQSHYHPYCDGTRMWGLEWPMYADAADTLHTPAWRPFICSMTHTVIFHPDPVDSISLAYFFSVWR